MTKVLSNDVLKRFMSQEEWDALMVKYNANKKTMKRERPVNDKDFLVLKQWKAGMKNLKDLAETNEMTGYGVRESLRLAALASL